MKKRSSNIELLRVISMFMVVMIHLMTKTSVLWEMDQSQAVYYISWFLYGLCMTGVNCYVLISGYFYKETKFKFEKLLSIYFQVLFYSVVIAAVMYLMKIELRSSKIGVILPITNREYWFATVYLGLCCLTPYLNIVIEHMEEKKLRQLLIVLGLLFSVIPTFLHADNWLEDGGAYGIVWFVFLYFTGGYIRKFYSGGIKKAGLYYLGCILIIPVSKYLILLFGRYGGALSSLIQGDKIIKISEVLYAFNSLPALCASVFLFLFFCSVQIKNVKMMKVINFFGSLTFGVYLIHNNKTLSHYLWENLHINDWLVKKNNIFMIIILWISVFIVCSMIELLRQQLFKLFKINKFINKIAEKINQIFL